MIVTRCEFAQPAYIDKSLIRLFYRHAAALFSTQPNVVAVAHLRADANNLRENSFNVYASKPVRSFFPDVRCGFGKTHSVRWKNLRSTLSQCVRGQHIHTHTTKTTTHRVT